MSNDSKSIQILKSVLDGGGCDEDDGRAVEECTICYLAATLPVKLPQCGHSFCFLCLKGVASRRNLRCPLCRTEFSSTILDSIRITSPIYNKTSSSAVSTTTNNNNDDASDCATVSACKQLFSSYNNNKKTSQTHLQSQAQQFGWFYAAGRTAGQWWRYEPRAEQQIEHKYAKYVEYQLQQQQQEEDNKERQHSSRNKKSRKSCLTDLETPNSVQLEQRNTQSRTRREPQSASASNSTTRNNSHLQTNNTQETQYEKNQLKTSNVSGEGGESELKFELVQLQISGYLYEIDFSRMVQFRSGHEQTRCRAIKRDLLETTNICGVAGVRLNSDETAVFTTTETTTEYPVLPTTWRGRERESESAVAASSDNANACKTEEGKEEEVIVDNAERSSQLSNCSDESNTSSRLRFQQLRFDRGHNCEENKNQEKTANSRGGE